MSEGRFWVAPGFCAHKVFSNSSLDFWNSSVFRKWPNKLWRVPNFEKHTSILRTWWQATIHSDLTGILLLMNQLVWRELLSLSYGIISYLGTTESLLCFINSITLSGPRRGLDHVSVACPLYFKTFPFILKCLCSGSVK